MVNDNELTPQDAKKSSPKRIYVVKAIIFALIFAVLLSLVSRIFTVNTGNDNYSLINSIYNEPENSLDAIYIGSSNCYYYWNSLAAYNEYGITVLPLASSAQSLIVAEYMIKEARKVHPDTTYIVNINTITIEGLEDLAMHYLLDNMPLSLNKLELTSFITKSYGLSFSESLEYYFPLLRYHSRWNELETGNFANVSIDYKNSKHSAKYLNTVTDLSEIYQTTNERMKLPDDVEKVINSLLDYCDSENVDVLFVTVPQARLNADEIKYYNTINDIISSRGYDVIDLLNNIEETGIDPATDFYNYYHTNIHGSLKFTHYISKYLVERYIFADKRNDPMYESWNSAYKTYEKYLNAFVLDFELDSDERNFALDAAADISAVKHEDHTEITWSAVEDADGYAVYKRSDNVWKKLGTTTALSITDNIAQNSRQCTYTVVAYTEDGEKISYGNFSGSGVACE